MDVRRHRKRSVLCSERAQLESDALIRCDRPRFHPRRKAVGGQRLHRNVMTDFRGTDDGLSIKRQPQGMISAVFFLGIDADLQISQALRRSEEHTSELQSPYDLVCRLLLEKK